MSRLAGLGGAFLVCLVCVAGMGCAPSNIATGTCTDTFLSTIDEWTCKVKGDVVGQKSSISFTTESRNQVAVAIIALQVTKGTLQVKYYDLNGEQKVLITPSEPMSLTMRTRLRRDDRSFTLYFEPVNGDVNGLTGTVKYSTP